MSAMVPTSLRTAARPAGATLLLPLLLSLGACASHGATNGAAPGFEVEGHAVRYAANGAELTGYLASPIGAEGDRPGILVVHEWWGHDEYARRRARELAQLGYVAFALDMYGTGKSATHPKDATAFMEEVMGNADTMEARFRAALTALHAAPGVDVERTGAIGYCMGGGIVLRMARATDTLDFAASFHGSLGAALGAGDAGGVKRVFIAHGADDPFVSMETLHDLTTELRAMPGIESVTVGIYPGAVHGFTNPEATQRGEEFGLPLRYDAAADAESWATLTAELRASFE
ncbi:MAG: dienelactone hydrolase family protein [Planctomycetota bacterium]